MNIQTWGYIRHLYFVERFSKKAIARELALDPKTVRRALAKDRPERKKPGPRSSKLDPFKEKIAELLRAYPRISAVRIHEEIRKAGYGGGMTILRTYARGLRPQKKAFLHIQTLPGEEAQVDWAYAGRIGDKPLYAFLMVLSFSKMLYVEFFSSQILENFLAGHLRAFHYFQGVAKKIRYDNLKSVVITRMGPHIQFNRRFLDFAAHYLFDPSCCNVRAPHEKGRVENAVRYVKNNFLAGRTFGSLVDCNQQARLWMEQTANVRLHGTTKARPFDLWEKERPLLIPLPITDYDTRICSPVKSTAQALVFFDTNRYRVPFTHAAMILTLKADEQFVSIYDKERLIAQHVRSHQKHQIVENPAHVQGLLAARPQGAILKHRDAMMGMGDKANQYLEAMTKTELNIAHQLKKIIGLIDLFGKTEVMAAMDQAMIHHALGYEYLQNIILANRRKRAITTPPGSPVSKIDPDLIRSTSVEERNPEIYDHYFNKETDHED